VFVPRSYGVQISTETLGVFLDSLCPSREMQGQHLKLGHDRLLPHPFNSTYTHQSTIWHCIIRVIKGVVTWAKPKIRWRTLPTSLLTTYKISRFLKSSIFWVVTPCSLLKVNRHFKGRRATGYPRHTGFLLRLFFDPKDEGDMLLRTVGWQADHTANNSS
jgi:hypothetical protein